MSRMIRKYRAVISTVCIVLSLGTLATAQETVLINSTNIEKETELILVEAEFELVNTLDLAELDIYLPHALTINSRGDIALMAWNKRKIFFFENGDFDNPIKLSSSRGRGPGEYESPFDLYLTDESKIWVSDLDRRKIEKWDPVSDKVIQSYKIDTIFNHPDQVVECVTHDGERLLYLLSVQYGPGFKDKVGILHSFVVKNDEVHQINTFQDLTKKDEHEPYAITGDLACDDSGGVYYSGDYSSAIRNFDRNGRVSFYRNSVATTITEPLFIQLNERMTRINPKAPKVNNGVFMAKNHLIVPTSDRRHSFSEFLDFYDPKTGEYKFTLTLPDLAREVVLNDDVLVAIEGVRTEDYVLKVYKFELPDE